MSKAVTMKSSWLKSTVKSVIRSVASGQGEFMRLFGASELYIKNVQAMGGFAHQALMMSSRPASEILLSSSLPSISALAPVPMATMVFQPNAQNPNEEYAVIPAQVPALTMGEVQQTVQTQVAPKAEDVSALVALLKDKGRKVSEVKALPSGTVKITLEDYLFGGSRRKPELVKVRR